MDSELQKILDLLKKGTYAQRIDGAAAWIDGEINRRKVALARDKSLLANKAFYKSKRITPLEIIKDLLYDLRDSLKAPGDLEAQIKCVKREIALRGAVYSKRVRNGKMPAETARTEYDAMVAVLHTLENINGNKGGDDD